MRIVLMFTFTALAFVFNSYMPSIPIVLWYLMSINLFTFLLVIIDKFNAIKDRKRVPESNLYFFAIAGGFLGLLIAMVLAKHKISKKSFLFVQLLITALWLTVIYYVLTHTQQIQAAIEILRS